MGDAEIKASAWKLVEVGRVVLIRGGPSDGRIATIVEIVDHKRVCSSCREWCTHSCVELTCPQVLVDGPAKDAKLIVPRQSVPLAHVVLTPLIIEKLPRGARTGAVKKLWEKAGIEEKYEEGTWAKKQVKKDRRRALTDFERFKVVRLRKQARFEVRKSLAKVRAAAK